MNYLSHEFRNICYPFEKKNEMRFVPHTRNNPQKI